MENNCIEKLNKERGSSVEKVEKIVKIFQKRFFEMKKKVSSYGNYPDLSHVERILVIKLRHLGDVLLTTPVFGALKKRFPSAKIDAYVYEESLEILEKNPHIDEIISYDRSIKKRAFFSKIGGEKRLLQKIRKKKYDLVINFTEGDRGVIASFISGAKIRVGNLPKSYLMKKLLTHIAKKPSTLRHTVEQNLDLLRKIGIFTTPEEKKLFFSIPQEQEIFAKKKAPFILIHPASRWKFKCWSIEKMRLLVEKLIEKGEKIILTAGKDVQEIEMVNEIAKDLAVENLAGKVSLKELGALIDAAKLVISVDSLPLHLASCFQKPNIVLFGPTSEVTWGPWQNPYAHVISSKISCRPCYLDGCGGSKKSDCLEQIDVEEVLAKIYTQ